jgi:membrane-associated phospholipid phosphatase
VLAGPVVAAVTLLTALLATQSVGVPFRDPDHVVGKRLAMVACGVALLVVFDIVVRAAWRSRRIAPSLAALRSVQRERWNRRRGAAVAIALVSFYVTYLAYRNLKSIIPLLRPDELFDAQLASFERSIFGGNDPAELLHTLLGTGVAAEILSVVYVLFIAFVPVSLALALVFSPDLKGGIFYATAMSINWGLGIVSYYLLPAMGPIFAAPAAFADLPATEVSRLQGLMLDQRIDFLRDPTAADAAQNIAAFGSLHVSIIFTAAIAAHMLGLGPRLKIGLWVAFALTCLATIYFGWHYVVDDVAGLAMGLTALALARQLTGFEQRIPVPRPGWAVRAAAALRRGPGQAPP